MNRPLLSILIATRNRQETASVVISEILNLELPDLELVVSDTSDEKNLLGLIKLRTDKTNLIYQHTPIALSMTENYSKTIDMASGEYLCMIGDDDFILPNIIEVASFAKASNLSSITQKILCNYIWSSQNEGNLHGQITIKNNIEVKHTENALKWILLKGGMMTVDAPRLYHGLVKKSLFDKLKKSKGKYFFGTSPDISASISICCLSDTYGYSSRQFTVPGASIRSNSNLGLKRLAPHKNTTDHVALHKDEVWPEIIPPLLCAETGWPEATYKTLKVHKENRLKDLNLIYCYFLMYIKYKSQYQFITPYLLIYLKKMSVSEIASIPFKLIKIFLYILFNKFRRILNGKRFAKQLFPSISGIQQIIDVNKLQCTKKHL